MWPSGVVRHQYRAQGKRSQEDRVHLPPLLKIGRTWSPGSQHSGPPAAAPGPRKGLPQQDFGSQTPKKMPPRRLGRRGGNDGNTGHMGPRPTSRRASTGQPWPGEALQLPNHPWLGRPIKRVREDRGPFAAILGIGEHGAEARVSGAQVPIHGYLRPLRWCAFLLRTTAMFTCRLGPPAAGFRQSGVAWRPRPAARGAKDRQHQAGRVPVRASMPRARSVPGGLALRGP